MFIDLVVLTPNPCTDSIITVKLYNKYGEDKRMTIRLEAIKSFDYFQLISHEKYVIFIE